MASLRHDKLVALPSLSCALSSLPQATSLDSVSLHPSMYAQHAADSEAKVLPRRSLSDPSLTPLVQLRKVLSKTASTPHSAAPTHPYTQSPSHADSPNSSPPLMMRKSQKPKFQA
ncbi:hypothetical protein J3R82DRAFT_1956 [Butyriboletus roseoflavus]|nr:hypothetical protein J3R82DRAFT_1956 [Butyriboletus roseoflavus]